MEISKVSYDQLKAGGVSTGDLLATMAKAFSHREVVKQEIRQTKKTFNDSQTGQTKREVLSPVEDFSLEVKAYDDANLKLNKVWPGHEWIVPPYMIGKALTIWPMVKKAELVSK